MSVVVSLASDVHIHVRVPHAHTLVSRTIFVYSHVSTKMRVEMQLQVYGWHPLYCAITVPHQEPP